MKERRAQEKRVAATPETVKKLIGLGYSVSVEAGAGVASQITDAEYSAAGATVEASPWQLLQDADIVVKVQRPLLVDEVLAGEGGLDELALFKRGSLLLASLAPFANTAAVYAYAAADITAIALEFVPDIAQAKSPDTLGSSGRLPGLLPPDASDLYAKNLLNYLSAQTSEGEVHLNWHDEVVTATVLTHAGAVVHPTFRSRHV